MIQNEIWAAVLGFETTYEVSTMGRVRRIRPGKGTTLNYVLKPVFNKYRGGYYTVALYPRKGVQCRRYIHRLVGAAFLQKQNETQIQINHKDGDKANNAASNLEWCSQTENAVHSYHTLGNRPPIFCGENNKNTTLTEAQVRLMKARLAEPRRGLFAELSREYGTSYTTVRNIATGRTWRYVASDPNPELAAVAE